MASMPRQGWLLRRRTPHRALLMWRAMARTQQKWLPAAILLQPQNDRGTA